MHMYNFLCSDSLLYFFLFLSTLHSVYTRDCSCIYTHTHTHTHACTHTHTHTHTCTRTHTDARLQMFGSSANGFGSKNSDLDLCMTLPNDDKVSEQERVCVCVWDDNSITYWLYYFTVQKINLLPAN